MRDEFFDMFIEAMGEATSQESVPAATIEGYRALLPGALLTYWKEEGWCGYANGLFWTVNPEEYKHILNMWLSETPFEEIDDYHVIARSGFGDLIAWGARTGRIITVSCPLHAIFALEGEIRVPSEDPDLEVQCYLSGLDRELYDQEDDQGRMLFDRAMAKLGPLTRDEVYGFEPALVAGGTRSLKNLHKLNLEVHLAILRQFSPPSMPFAGLHLDLE